MPCSIAPSTSKRGREGIYAEGAFISGKSNMNDRRAVFTVISVVHTIEENIDKIFLNRSSDNATVLNIEKREIVRIKAWVLKLRNTLNNYWNRKSMKNWTGVEKNDKLLILVSSNSFDRILEPQSLDLEQNMPYVMLLFKPLMSGTWEKTSKHSVLRLLL